MKRILPALLILPMIAHGSPFASGGTEIVLDGGDTIVHVFTESGTFTLN